MEELPFTGQDNVQCPPPSRNEEDDDVYFEPCAVGEHTSQLSASSIDIKIQDLASEISVSMKVSVVRLPTDPDRNFQDEIEHSINELKEIRNYFDVKLVMIDKMNLLMNILTFKIYEIQHNYKSKIDQLSAEKENILLSKIDEKMKPIELLNLDKIIREYQNQHHKHSSRYRQKKLDIQLEYENATHEMDDEVECMNNNIEKLKKIQEKLSKPTTEAKPVLIELLINEAIIEFRKYQDQLLTKQVDGWKTSDEDVKLLDDLQARGMAVTKSGFILTSDGEKLSLDEAEKRELLHGLDLRSKLQPKEIPRNDDIVSKSGSLQSQETAKDSLSTRMSTDDVSYLKETLGKPLTLALAEITTKQPRDPIHYLGHWLFKYRYNQELDAMQKQEYDALMAERNRILKDKLHKLYEDEARMILYEMVNNADNIVLKKELERILREQAWGEEEGDDENAAHEYAELKKLLAAITAGK